MPAWPSSQTVCLFGPLAGLTRALQQISADPQPGELMRVPLRAIEGGKG